ncbi:hypothetical protein JCM10213_001117 [Rhodosporidiobolus nylandii]
MKHPNRLRVDDARYGEDPKRRYRGLDEFVKFKKSYAWLNGYDVKVSHQTATGCRLICATDMDCHYNCIGESTIFTDAPGSPSGYQIVRDSFRPTHSHPPPFVPLDVQAENGRRAALPVGDPRVEEPPLVPVGAAAPALSVRSGSASGFAGGASDAGSSISGRGRGVSVLHRTGNAWDLPGTPASAAVTGGSSASGSREQMPLPTPGQQQQQRAYYAPPSQQQQQQYQPPVPQPASQPPPQQQTYLHPPPPAYASAAPSPTPTPSLSDAQTPLGSFLLSISPSFAPHLPSFAAASIPLSTDPSELLDLDSGLPDDRTVFDVFKDVSGLPPFLVALGADGVRKARGRREAARREGTWAEGHSRPDGRIAVGLEKARAEKWVRERIRIGEGILAQSDAQARQQQGLAARL